MDYEQFIKALTICLEDEIGGCDECPMIDSDDEGKLCSEKLVEEIANTFRKKDEEIKELKSKVKYLQSINKKNDEHLHVRLKEQARAEAFKELSKEIINNILPEYLYGHDELALRIGFAISEKINEMR